MIRNLLYLMICMACLSKAKAQNALAVLPNDTVIMSADFPVIISLDGTASTSDSEILDYYWVLQGDTIDNSPQIELALNDSDNEVRLVVIDASGDIDAEIMRIFVGHPTNNGKNRIPIRAASHLRFMSGINIAWRNFANDLNEWTIEDEIYFGQIMDSIQAAGGNTLRWWLHTNGANSPVINADGFVERIDFESILAMKHFLDMAYDHGIVVSMCLWSFDMLQNQNRNAMLALLQDTSNIRSYIDNALIPLLEAVGNHPAVMTWEIFNEAEGMTSQYGWTPTRVSMTDVQVFVNLIAGAIHRTIPEAQVSTGAWNVRVMSDIGNFINYYSDEALQARGGDPDGYLDFYQMHYYAEHFNNSYSPFHRPASHWELDKPIVIGETWADTICCLSNPDLSITEAFERTVDYGYAGLMTWSWTDRSDFGPTSRGIKRTAQMIPNDLEIPTDLDIDRVPQIIGTIPPFRATLEALPLSVDWADLKNYFTDEEQGSYLTYTISSISNNAVTLPGIGAESQVVFDFSNPSAGLTEIVYRASDINGWYSESESIVMLGSLAENADNLAFYKTVHTNSVSGDDYNLYINDGNTATSWKSIPLEFETVIIDLDSVAEFNFIGIHLRDQSLLNYSFYLSEDSTSWEALFDESYGLEDEIGLGLNAPVHGRYLRLELENALATDYFEVYELEVQNVEQNQPPTLNGEVDDLIQQLSDVKNINNYIRFEELFTDTEHQEYLQYTFGNSNPELLTPEFSIGQVGLSLIFGEGQVGSSTIEVTATDPFGATVSTSFEVVVEDNIVSGIEEPVEITVFPNPSDGLFMFKTDKSSFIPTRIEIFGMNGRLMLEIDRQNSDRPIDISRLPAGVYLLKASDASESITKRIIKK